MNAADRVDRTRAKRDARKTPAVDKYAAKRPGPEKDLLPLPPDVLEFKTDVENGTYAGIAI